ncbi:MAG: MFS transporter [Actinomycetaceae bacterium]|nr:MFS transporter [Actinomycetaceae bacterium]
MARISLPGAPLLLGSGLFNFASGCYTIVLGQSLFHSTGSVAVFTAVVTIEYIGPILLAAIAGTLSDRINSALLCMWASFLAAVSVAAYIAAPHHFPLAGLALGIAMNILRPFYRAGIFAAGPRTVSPIELPLYNLRWTVSVQGGQIIGGAIGAAALAYAGELVAFGIASVAFALAAASLWVAKSRIRSHTPPSENSQARWRDILRDFAQWPKVFALLLVGADFVTISAFTVALAPLVAQVFTSPFWLGILDALFAGGALLVTFIGKKALTRTTSLRRSISLGYAIQILGLATLAATLAPHIPAPFFACLGSVILGAGMALSSSQQVSFLQSNVKDSVIGKVGALRQAVIGVTTAAVLPVIGFVIELSVAAAYLSVAGFFGVCLAINTLLARRQ